MEFQRGYPQISWRRSAGSFGCGLSGRAWVRVIYFNHLFVSPSNHKYDIPSYDCRSHCSVIIEDGGGSFREKDNTRGLQNIEADGGHFGIWRAAAACLQNWWREIHLQGMRVIMTGVPICGSFNKWMDRERIWSTAEYEKVLMSVRRARTEISFICTMKERGVLPIIKTMTDGGGMIHFEAEL